MMRLTTDIQRTTSRGKAITPKYPGRETSPKADSKKNIYGHIITDENGKAKFEEFKSDWKGRCLDLRHCEEDYYTEQFGATVNYINDRYIRDGHKDRIVHKTAKEWLKDPKYAPYRMSLGIGTIREHATDDQIKQLTKALTEHIADRYKHIQVMGIAVHFDGEVPDKFKHMGYTTKGDAHISMASKGVQKTTRKGVPITDAEGNPIYDFDIYKALEMDKVEKWFKDGDGIIKPISDPNIYDRDLLKKTQKTSQYCNELIGFTQEIREWAFDYCEKEFGLVLEREPDERRSRDPYEFRQKSNTRLSKDEYIKLDELQHLISEAVAEIEDIKKDAADVAEATDLEIKVYSKVYLQLKKNSEKDPKTKQWLERLENEQLEKEQDRQRRGQLLLQQAQQWIDQQQTPVKPSDEDMPS